MHRPQTEALLYRRWRTHAAYHTGTRGKVTRVHMTMTKYPQQGLGYTYTYQYYPISTTRLRFVYQCNGSNNEQQ